MRAVRSMVLVSGDPDSLELGSEKIFKTLETEFKKFGIQEEISLSMMSDVGRHDAFPSGYCLSGSCDIRTGYCRRCSIYRGRTSL